ncbi:MAG TPA: tetratricopeptide repeat protein [Candidatus Acidoferrales bacterium]|nr:tetratricopeptide repeat protein [Candidatus Acidoferrales bacterium]
MILHSRETVLSLTVLIVAVLFSLTGFVTRGYHHELSTLGRQWFETGEQQLKTGNAAAALADFHTALVYSPDDTRIQFQLAQALAVEGRNGEARAYLLELQAHAPSDAPINLALARISAGAGSVANALRYYHGAIYGVWPQEAEANRLSARLELSRFLISRGNTSIANAELIALASEIPEHNGASLHTQTGELFLRAGNASRALSEFRDALTVTHPPADALRGAGLAAYQLGEFQQAERYLDRAHRLRTDDAEVSLALNISRLVMSADPYAFGLSESERRERARRDFEQAFTRLQSCAKARGVDLFASGGQQSDLVTLGTQAKALRPQLTDQNLRRHPGQFDVAMNFVFVAEGLATKECGAPQNLDEALTLIGKFHQGRER